MKSKEKKGIVYLVGAGPGDPGLLTIKGRACIEKADVLVYDYLASPVLLNYRSPKAEVIYVGKKGGNHTLSQEGINDLIVQKALEGNTVTRLKGGDPFIFGRGGEEAEELIKAGVPFEIVPGVTSAIAAPAYAGIPLTHRRYTSTVAFVTGHEDPTKEESSIDWPSLAKGIGTIVFLMGVKNLPHIVAKLKEHGKPGATRAALVRWGTHPGQETVTGTLDDIVERAAHMKAPSIIVVGNVVELRGIMTWFEKKPLFGKRIVVTRARAQSSDLLSMISEAGAECIEYPAIRIEPMDDFTELDKAIKNLSTYDWLVFTSVNGVETFFTRLFNLGLDLRAVNNVKTAVIGPATQSRLMSYGLKSDIVPESYRAESVITAFENEDMKSKKVLLPRAKDARPILPIELEKMGASVDEVIVYRAVKETEQSEDLLSRLREKTVDMITFTSSSTVKNFCEILPENEKAALLSDVKVASIGPITSKTAADLGFACDVEADVYTIPGLFDAIVTYYGKNA